MTIRFLVVSLLMLEGIHAVAQSPLSFTNTEGRYRITPLAEWRAKAIGNSTYVYAPADGAMDPWDEKIDISIAEANDNNVDEAFDFFINTDFPETYAKFSVLKKGEEIIHGVKARWAVFSFSGSGAAEGANESNTVTATLQTLFYLIEKNNKLYFITGITEKSLFGKFEPDFRRIIRTIEITE
jgi:hypothetical protein